MTFIKSTNGYNIRFTQYEDDKISPVLEISNLGGTNRREFRFLSSDDDDLKLFKLHRALWKSYKALNNKNNISGISTIDLPFSTTSEYTAVVTNETETDDCIITIHCRNFYDISSKITDVLYINKNDLYQLILHILDVLLNKGVL